jgi:nitrate/TMAO reductase-like tetraheme cytochrome c subunit
MHHFLWGTGWRRFFFAIAVTILILVVFLTITIQLTSTPKFCNSCHNMKPYYESWKHSSHKDVTCTDCHFPPGIKSKIKGKLTALSMLVNYFTGVYKRNKPWAEISDESCMRSGCHETRKLEGRVDYKKILLLTTHLI